MTDSIKAQVASPYFDMTGKVAVITGGGRGLGREMATAFALHGATVVIASRKLDVLEATAAELTELTGQRIVPMTCHVGQWDQVTQFVDDVYAELGKVDVLVNNAGMSPLYKSLSDISEDLWDKVIDVNVKGPFRMSALVGERMAAGEGGSIINVSSIAATIPTEIEVPYGVAKAGIHNLTVGLAKSYGPKVRVNCIQPGMFRTDISKAWDIQAVEAMAQAEVPLERIGEPSEIIGAALYLASDAASYTTGSILKVDGGHTKAV